MPTLDDTVLLRLIAEAMSLVSKQLPIGQQRLPWREELACAHVLMAVLALHDARAALTIARWPQHDA